MAKKKKSTESAPVVPEPNAIEMLLNACNFSKANIEGKELHPSTQAICYIISLSALGIIQSVTNGYLTISNTIASNKSETKGIDI